VKICESPAPYKSGVMECCSEAVMEKFNALLLQNFRTPELQYSNTPLLHHSKANEVRRSDLEIIFANYKITVSENGR
jgi:hypothetical protein